jgi:hypothetical protein
MSPTEDTSGISRRRFIRCRPGAYPVPLHLGATVLEVVVADLGRGGIRIVGSSLRLDEGILFQIYLARADDRRVVAWGQVVRRDEHGLALSFARVEPDSVGILSDVTSWEHARVTAIYISPSAPSDGRTWWTLDRD